MRIEWKSATDEDELAKRIEKATKQRKTLQRDRLRVVLLAGEGDPGDGGELFREQIAQRVRRSRQFVDHWVGRYRKGGLDALEARKQPGASAASDARTRPEA